MDRIAEFAASLSPTFLLTGAALFLMGRAAADMMAERLPQAGIRLLMAICILMVAFIIAAKGVR